MGGSVVLAVGLLALNVAIAWWNCYVVGSAWDMVKHHGSRWEKVILWSGAIQSTVGFSMPIVLGLAFVSVGLLSSGEQPTLTKEEAAAFMQGVFSLWYLAVIVPVLGSGFAIWVHSIQIAIQRRDFQSIATAAWNTYANVKNFSGAWSGIGDAFKALGNVSPKGSSKDSGKVMIVLLLIMIVVVALLAGALITASLIQRYRRLSVTKMAHA